MNPSTQLFLKFSQFTLTQKEELPFHFYPVTLLNNKRLPSVIWGVALVSHFLYQNKISLSRSRLVPVVPSGLVPQINFEFFQSAEMVMTFFKYRKQTKYQII